MLLLGLKNNRCFLLFLALALQMIHKTYHNYI